MPRQAYKLQKFWDQFSAAVDSNTKILNVVKFTYVKSTLNKDVVETATRLTLSKKIMI